MLTRHVKAYIAVPVC